VTICLVTDRRRLVPPGAADDVAAGCLAAQVRHAAEAGIDLVQLRERDLDPVRLAAQLSLLRDAVRGTATRIVVNDRVDVALACGAHGVHLRADSMPVAAARRIVPSSFVVGRSVHSVGELADAEGADYLIAGTVFASASKPEARALLGLDGLAAITRGARVPVLAIGGITVERAADLAAAGAAGIAAIGLFLGDSQSGCRATPLADTVARLRGHFVAASRPNPVVR
jgi:thiamine-phosphate diphosphorylase